MAGKAKKAPGIFKKPVKKNKWEKKYLKKLYLPDDQKFLKSLAVEEGDRIRINVEGLSKKDLKRLKALGKTITANRKKFNFIIIFILVILVGGGVFFEFYLKDKLVRDFIETQLESIFLAQVDTDGVSLSVINGELSLDYLAVANAQKPMMNLFECSSVTADLDTAELLQGRVFIESLGFEGLKRNTKRSESGELKIEEGSDAAEVEASEASARPGSKIADKGTEAVTGVVNQLGSLAGEIDVEEILAAQKEKLKSFKFIEESEQLVREYSDTWQNKAGEWEQKIAGWQTSVDYIKTVNADSFQTLESAGSTIEKLEGIYSNAESDYNSVQNDFSEAEKQYNEASAMLDNIQAAVEADFEYIESLVTIPEGSKVDWAASILEEQLSMPVSKYLAYFNRGFEWYNRFKRLSEIRKENSPDERRPGRRLPPPADAPPGFVLKHAYASGEEPDLEYKVNLYNFVTEPEKWPERTSLAIAMTTPATGAAEAEISEDSMSINVPAAPYDLGDLLKELDISSFSGSLSLKSEVRWDDAGFNGLLNLESPDITIASASPDKILFRMINTTLESVKPFSAGGDFYYGKDGNFDLALDTEMDDRLGDAASALLAEGADEGLKMLKDYMNSELEGPLGDFDAVKDDLAEYTDRIKNYEQELDKYRKMADDKIAEIEKSVKENLTKQAEDLIKNAVPADVQKSAEDAAESLKSTFGSKLKF